MTDHKRLLILVGLTGTGKTTTVNAMRDQGCAFQLLPNRRDLTDDLIIAHLQEMDGEPITAVTDRTQRFAYTRRYRELFPGGMAKAVNQWLIVNSQLSIVNDETITHYELRIFDGLRGENEIIYAAKNILNAWFLFLDAPDFVRVQRLLGRNDAFDQVMVEAGDGETAVSLDPSLTAWLTTQQRTQLENDIHNGELPVEDVQAKLTIVQKERQNYDPDATLAALRQYAPDRLIYAYTVAYSPEEIAQQVIAALRKVTPS